MNKEFREYIRMLISEIMEENSLPTASQLVSSSKDKGETPVDKDSEEDEELDEFSGVGAIGGGGFSLPLGMSPDQPIPGSTSRKKSKKRKNPSWA